MILISQHSCAHHPLNHLHHAFTVHPQSYVCYSIINFSAWNSYITWKNIVASSTNPETRDVKSGCWSVAEELNREFKSTLFQYKQKSESRNEPRDAQLLVLVWRTVLKWLFQTPPHALAIQKWHTHSANMTLLSKLLQTFWLALTARVQHLSSLSSKIPSLWLCLCKSSTSSCWDVSPVLTVHGIKDRKSYPHSYLKERRQKLVD